MRISRCCDDPDPNPISGTVICRNCGIDYEIPVYEFGTEFSRREGYSINTIEKVSNTTLQDRDI